MLKKINRVLKLVGLNLVRSKRRKSKWQAVPPVPPPSPEEIVSSRDTEKDLRWHYVGDTCPGGHADWETSGGTTPEQNEARFETPRVEQPNSDNKISGPTS